MTKRPSLVIVAVLVLAGLLAGAPALPAASVVADLSVSDAIRTAVLSRVGGDAVVSIKSIDTNQADLRVREARPDPAARLGNPVRFSLITGAGPVAPVTANIEVVVTHTVARQEIGRGHSVERSAIQEVKGVLTGVPIGRVVTGAEALGARTLRPIAPGTVLVPSYLALRRVIEPGDEVTATALMGLVQVSATFVAVDGGAIGDLIRVRNPQTRKYVRGRIVKAGAVEVIHER
jgi:flagella basal body P-ring formation protein FlgA